jgi:hypothetical protein
VAFTGLIIHSGNRRIAINEIIQCERTGPAEVQREPAGERAGLSARGAAIGGCVEASFNVAGARKGRVGKQLQRTSHIRDTGEIRVGVEAKANKVGSAHFSEVVGEIELISIAPSYRQEQRRRESADRRVEIDRDLVWASIVVRGHDKRARIQNE